MTEVIRAAVFKNGKMTVTPFDISVKVEERENDTSLITFYRAEREHKDPVSLGSFLVGASYAYYTKTGNWWGALMRALPENPYYDGSLNTSPWGNLHSSDDTDSSITIYPNTLKPIFILHQPFKQDIYLEVDPYPTVKVPTKGVTSCTPYVDIEVQSSRDGLEIKTTRMQDHEGRTTTIHVDRQWLFFNGLVSEEDWFTGLALGFGMIQPHIEINGGIFNCEPGYVFERHQIDGFIYFRTVNGEIYFTLESNPHIKLSFLLLKRLHSLSGDKVGVDALASAQVTMEKDVASFPENFQSAAFLHKSLKLLEYTNHLVNSK